MNGMTIYIYPYACTLNLNKDKTIQGDERIINILQGNRVDVILRQGFYNCDFIDFRTNSVNACLPIPQTRA